VSTTNVNTPSAGVSIPLSAAVRAAYQDLYNKIQAEIDNTMDAVALEALNPQLNEVDQVLTKDDEYKLTQDTVVFAALKKQIVSVNQGIKTLRAEIASTASHFATAGAIIGAIDKVLTLVPGL
jgi:DNA-binding protein YbaB